MKDADTCGPSLKAASQIDIFAPFLPLKKSAIAKLVTMNLEVSGFPGSYFHPSGTRSLDPLSLPALAMQQKTRQSFIQECAFSLLSHSHPSRPFPNPGRNRRAVPSSS